MEDKDYLRFIHDLFEFNDQNKTESNFYKFYHQSHDLRSREIGKKSKNPRKLLVDVLAFCLMPNHYHLLLQSRIENGIVEFMRKLNIGYAKYFNEKYQRSGALFEGRYKSVLVENEAHFVHLPYYIHLNPLDLKMPEWRERKLDDFEKAMNFLDSYRWSSHLDYSGRKNFPSVTQRGFLLEFFGGEKKYVLAIKNWLKDIQKRELKIEDYILE